MGAVISLCEHAPVPSDDLRAWADAWLDGIMDGDFGPVKSLIIVVENEDGELNHVAQSKIKVDGYRLIGLLTHLTRRIGESYDD